MGNYILENEAVKVTIRNKSAEMISLIKKETGAEYLWNGDAKYWGWTSPVLFPFVGSVRDKQYRFEGKTYPMNQHGFARNQEFSLLSRTEQEIWFCLEDTEEFRVVYPFAFQLELGYRLTGSQVQVCWRVINKGEETLYFSIGGHPAFLCPLDPGEKQTDCYMGFETEKEELAYRLVDASGLLCRKEYPLKLNNGLHRIGKDRFDKDALVIEGSQTGKVWLAGADQKPYVTVEFDAPLFGLWSPAGKHAPFVCIEPWYGRCDANDFYGELAEREYGNTLEAGGVFERSYSVTV